MSGLRRTNNPTTFDVKSKSENESYGDIEDEYGEDSDRDSNSDTQTKLEETHKDQLFQ